VRSLDSFVFGGFPRFAAAIAGFVRFRWLSTFCGAIAGFVRFQKKERSLDFLWKHGDR
jgi:hypothetical protein